ncbi:MAG TPA: Crp/Fnr family transcriptional regulator [Puia sp.]|nr:Crp/Fnr family transcriptional regulator [Puia sp.]
MLDALRQYLSRYVPLSNEEFAFLADKLVIRNFDKKQQLVNVGEVETSLNFIVKGLLRKFFYRDKTEVITQIAREGEIISSSASFLSGTPSPYIVEAIEPATVFSISKKHLEKLYDSSPRIERAGRLILTHLFLQKEEWEQGRIRMDTRERFLHFVQNNPDLLQRVPQKYLASYLNMKPETFSRFKHLLYRRPPAEQHKASQTSLASPASQPPKASQASQSSKASHVSQASRSSKASQESQLSRPSAKSVNPPSGPGKK